MAKFDVIFEYAVRNCQMCSTEMANALAKFSVATYPDWYVLDAEEAKRQVMTMLANDSGSSGRIRREYAGIELMQHVLRSGLEIRFTTHGRVWYGIFDGKNIICNNTTYASPHEFVNACQSKVTHHSLRFILRHIDACIGSSWSSLESIVRARV